MGLSSTALFVICSVQAGDPQRPGLRESRLTIPGEMGLPHDKGALGWANPMNPETDQMFLNFTSLYRRCII